MSATNRSARIAQLATTIRSYFTPVPQPSPRPLFETLLFASLLENSTHDVTEKTFATLQAEYFDWNEVRVSTKRELSEALKNLTDPLAAAERLKATVQSIFESVYSFDIEGVKKQTLGQALAVIEKYKGVTPFAVAYVTQNALGGHSIPVNQGLLMALVALDVITPAEAEKGVVPGLERAIPKNKGFEVGSMLHQLGVEVGRNPYGPQARKLLLTMDPDCKDRLPKRPAPPEPPKPEEPKQIVSKAKPAPAKGGKKAAAAAEEKAVAPKPAATTKQKKEKPPAAAPAASAGKTTPAAKSKPVGDGKRAGDSKSKPTGAKAKPPEAKPRAAEAKSAKPAPAKANPAKAKRPAPAKAKPAAAKAAKKVTKSLGKRKPR